LNENEIMTVRDLHGLHSSQKLIFKIARRKKGLPVASIMRFLENIKDLSHEDAPLIVYYCNKENPYAAKFGLEENKWGEPAWIHEIKSLQIFAKTVCIINLVKHMVMEANKCYANKQHKNTYSIYKWMKTSHVLGENKLVYNRFINPLNDLNDMFGRRWAGRLVGNTPKVMPLNNSLFQDVKESVQKHVAMSLTICSAGIKDDCLFLTTTPKDAWNEYS
jgi:hypothetical protein